MTSHLIALLFHITESLGIRLVETPVWSHMLHAQSLGDDLHTLELYYTAVGSHLFQLLAILYIDVRGPMLLSMLNGKAIPGGQTLTTETLHLWTNLVHTQPNFANIYSKKYLGNDRDFNSVSISSILLPIN